MAARFISFLFLFSAGCAAQNTLVETQYGSVEGYILNGTRQWKGIPYAAPPVGPSRWANPEAPKSWSNVLSTVSYSAACPQDCNLPPLTCPASVSEDCLYLNVYSPLNVSSLLPVMVFFHGGRYEQGAAGVDLYEGYALAKMMNVVVVTVNYRLGVLGFLTLDGFTGNYGVLDQRFSLQWVQANIKGFGGDPSLVTIFGQSAGAMSVAFHLVTEQSKGLFQRAIIESCPFALPLLDPSETAEHGATFAADAGCTDPFTRRKCLLSLSPSQVVAAEVKAQQRLYVKHPTSLFFPWVPNVDGVDLTDQPLNLLMAGKWNSMPLMIGHVTEEGRIFIWEAAANPLQSWECEAVVAAVFVNDTEKVLEKYPFPSGSPDCREQLAALATDYEILCSSRQAARYASQAAPVYRYSFAHAWEFIGAWGPNYTFCEGHVCHGSELPFVFDSVSFYPQYSFSPDEVVLASTMVQYWANFAASGNPNSASVPDWPSLSFDDPNIVANLTVPACSASTEPRAEYCDFWDTIRYNH